jgi:hypothetical protein
MIPLEPLEDDDEAFLDLAGAIANGAVAALQVPEVYLVHVDNWFDFKWLGWWSWGKTDDRGPKRDLRKLYVPPFHPNRVRAEKRFLWDADDSRWTPERHAKPLHRRQPGRSVLAEPLEKWSKSAAFIWYSGNTVTNTTASLMLYASDTPGYAWYASFKNNQNWHVDRLARITKNELASFEQRGREMATSQS